jgi:hypothetical protein
MKSYRQVLQSRVPEEQRKTRDLVILHGVHTLSALIRKLEQGGALPGPSEPSEPTPPGRSGLVTCSAEVDGNFPGSGGITNMRIFGGGFVPGETVEIVDNNQIATTDEANDFGQYSVTLGFLHVNPPAHHAVHAHGQRSGRISNTAGFNL